ncbi:MBL fold metallo-hydrolase [Chakrabartia godavariana]|nr:MBL fold metallo-hydrolase [Chakrabartia godavariana]
MKTTGRIALTLSGLLVLLGGAAYANRDRILMRVYERALDKAMSRDVMATLDPKALHVGFCGTGSPLPSRDRASACTVAVAGGKLFVFDAGEGAGETLSLMGLPLGKIEGVYLTHLHSDHFEGLGPLALQRWAGTAAQTALPVLGPEGTQKIAEGLNIAYGPDGGYRMAHHGPVAVPPSGFGFAATVLNPGVVYDKDGVKITAFPVNHAPVAPAFGYRLDWQGKSVTISGDTAKAPQLAGYAKGTDLLVHEVLNPTLVEDMAKAAERHGQKGRAKIFRDIQTYHSSPQVAGDAATAAGAKMLAFTHVVPSLPRPLMRLVTVGAADHYGGPIRTMRDGDLLSITGQGEPAYRNLLD